MALNEFEKVIIKKNGLPGTIVDISEHNGTKWLIVESDIPFLSDEYDGYPGKWKLFHCTEDELEATRELNGFRIRIICKNGNVVLGRYIGDLLNTDNDIDGIRLVTDSGKERDIIEDDIAAVEFLGRDSSGLVK